MAPNFGAKAASTFDTNCERLMTSAAANIYLLHPLIMK